MNHFIRYVCATCDLGRETFLIATEMIAQCLDELYIPAEGETLDGGLEEGGKESKTLILLLHLTSNRSKILLCASKRKLSFCSDLMQAQMDNSRFLEMCGWRGCMLRSQCTSGRLSHGTVTRASRNCSVPLFWTNALIFTSGRQ